MNEFSQRRIKGKSMNTMASRFGKVGRLKTQHVRVVQQSGCLSGKFTADELNKNMNDNRWPMGQWYFTKLDLIQMLGHYGSRIFLECFIEDFPEIIKPQWGCVTSLSTSPQILFWWKFPTAMSRPFFGDVCRLEETRKNTEISASLHSEGINSASTKTQTWITPG